MKKQEEGTRQLGQVGILFFVASLDVRRLNAGANLNTSLITTVVHIILLPPLSCSSSDKHCTSRSPPSHFSPPPPFQLKFAISKALHSTPELNLVICSPRARHKEFDKHKKKKKKKIQGSARTQNGGAGSSTEPVEGSLTRVRCRLMRACCACEA